MMTQISLVIIEAAVGALIGYYLEKKGDKGAGTVAVCTIALIVLTLLLGNPGGSGGGGGGSTAATTATTASGNRGTASVTRSTEAAVSDPDQSAQQAVLLTKMEPVFYENLFHPTSKEDILGEQYDNVFYSFRRFLMGEQSMTYFLEKKYSKLDFKLGVNAGSKGEPGFGSLFIYADGKKIVNEPAIPCNFVTQDYSVDLTGVNYLKIEMYANDVSVLMIEPTLSPNRKKLPVDPNDSGIFPLPQQEEFLVRMEPYTYEGGSVSLGSPLARKENAVDVSGNMYLTAYYSYSRSENGKKTETFRLDKEYQNLVFKYGANENSKGNKGYGSLYIYADGKAVFSEPQIPCNIETKEKKISLKGVTDLTIEMYDDGVSVLMIDPILYR